MLEIYSIKNMFSETEAENIKYPIKYSLKIWIRIYKQVKIGMDQNSIWIYLEIVKFNRKLGKEFRITFTSLVSRLPHHAFESTRGRYLGMGQIL